MKSAADIVSMVVFLVMLGISAFGDKTPPEEANMWLGTIAYLIVLRRWV